MIKSFIFLLFISITVSNNCWSQDKPNFAVDKIPATLLENAEMVVREDNQVYEVGSPTDASLKATLVLTILKDGALDETIMNLVYDQFSKVNIASVIVYDKDGKKVKKVKNEDILDLSAIDNSSIYTDARRKYIDPEYQNLPFTVEYIYTYKYNTTFYSPSFSAFSAYNASVEHTSLKVICLSENQFRIKERNGIQSVVKTNVDGKIVYEWQVNNFVAPKVEPFSINPYDLYPKVDIAPTNFEMDGYEGDMTSWKDFGVFMNKLLIGKDVLPIETVAEIQKLVSDCKSDKEKIGRLYEYSQNKNRYVSIQIGIGGYQPFDATTVDRLSYGDCKALSNYVVSLLSVAGIKSYFTLIGAGDVPLSLDPQFPDNRFNHAVVCVPTETDTTWLECTSQFVPTGYFGSFTDNRWALLIKEDGGQLVKTNYHTAKDNLETTKGEIKLMEDGFASAQFCTKYSGVNYDDQLHILLRDEKKRRDIIINECHIPSFNLVNYQLTDHHNSEYPEMVLNMNVDINNCASLMGGKLYLALNQYNRCAINVPYMRKRVSDLYIVQNHSECDTTIYTLPQGFKVEALPGIVEMESKFGAYKCKAQVDGDMITYIRYFMIKEGRHPADQYNEFRSFLEKVTAADNAKCIIAKEI